MICQKVKINVQGVPQSQIAATPFNMTKSQPIPDKVCFLEKQNCRLLN